MSQFDYPFHIDGRGRVAQTTDEEHVRDLIEQVLLTSPGERVMRPTFVCGVGQLVFAPNSAELAAATQMLVQGALQQWLDDLIVVEAVQVDAIDSTLTLAVRYTLRLTQERREVRVTVPGGAP